MSASDTPKEPAVVTVKLTDASIQFVLAALDLLVEIEHADEVLVTDEIKESAARLRRVTDGGDF